MSALCQTASTAPEEHWQRLCKEFEHVKLPDADRPSAGAKQALAHCDSADLYYGITRPADPVKARQCAYLEMGTDHEPAFGGQTMLMMVYANGKGATRNFDIAIKMACEIGGAPAEISSRVEHLAQLKEEHWSGYNFDLCDDVTSGYMSGFCAGLQEDFKEQKRSTRLKAMLARWGTEERQAFHDLQQAEDEYVRTVGKLEVDHSGSYRASIEIQAESTLKEEFVLALEQFEQGKLPHFSQAEFAQVNDELNAVYKAIPRPLEYEDVPGMPTAEGVRKTEMVWIRYRDAWVEFGRKKYPQVSAESWKTWLTRDRTEMLKAFLPDKP
jgi:uncharacterized protein YecT (DUF1311 family)